MKKSAEIILFVLSLAIIFFLGLNSSRFFARLDLTESKAFSISKVSKKLFQEIPDQVYITYYLSDKLRSLYAFPTQIEDLLLEYSAYSHGKIKAEIMDPLKGGEAARAESLGIYPQQIEVVERDQRSLAKVYTGIVIQYLDRYETIPVAARLETLEYELTSRIRKVASGEERVIGILLGDSGRNLQEEYSHLLTSLSRGFKVKALKAGEDIPDDVDLLFVIGNQDLDDFDLFPVDQFIMRGGKALFAVDGVRIDFLRGLTATSVRSSPVLEMLAAYGVEVKRGLVLDKYSQNFRLPTQLFGQVMWQVMDKYPYWITVAGQFVSKENPITARFSGLDLYWASPLELVEGKGAQGEVLARTTPDGWVLDQEPFETDPQRAQMMLYMDHENKGQYPLAVSLKGQLASYFKGRGIPTRKGEKREWSQVLEAGKETRLIVVGDSDFASNLLEFTDATYNLEFLANAAEWLANAEDLLTIKTRTARDMRLNKIQEPARKLRSILFTELFNVAAVPLAVIGFGIGRLVYRRRKSIARVEEE